MSNETYSLHNDLVLVLTSDAQQKLKRCKKQEVQDFFSWAFNRQNNPMRKQHSYEWSQLEMEDIEQKLIKEFLQDLSEDKYKYVRLGDEFPDYDERGKLDSAFRIYPEVILRVGR